MSDRAVALPSSTAEYAWENRNSSEYGLRAKTAQVLCLCRMYGRRAVTEIQRLCSEPKAKRRDTRI